MAMSSAAPKIRFRDSQIEMAHGAGGKASRRLIEGLIAPLLLGPSFEPLADAAHVRIDGTIMALTTDSFVVKPLRFPGGSIGELAVNGTVNDLAMAGAKPLEITISMIIEEGLDAHTLREEVDAIARAARAAGVSVVGGDTKVVERGAADQMYLTSTGIGFVDRRADLAPKKIRPGDRI